MTPFFFAKVKSQASKSLALGFKYSEIVADAGYESEENYLFIEENGQVAFIKPSNYEQSKKHKFKKDISRMENMVYDEKKDLYICHAGKELRFQYEKNVKTATGYKRVTSVYQCSECKGCAYKSACIKGNNLQDTV